MRLSAHGRRRLEAACARIVAAVRSDHSYGHTTHLLVWVDGDTVHDEHFGGPDRADVFSVTKSVLATVVGCAVHERLVPALDDPVSDVLPALRGTPSAAHTWRHLLTMTRGSATDGPWEVDEVTALPGGQVAHVAAAPQLDPPGTAFRYDNGGSHLLSAALGVVVGRPAAAYAQHVLFSALGIAPTPWLADPDGVTYGFGHLTLGAADLLRLGRLWLDGGRIDGTTVVDPGFLAAMTTQQVGGGPPEGIGYGYLTWVEPDLIMAGGWAGQHLVVLPERRAIVVTTGDPQFTFGPPPSDRLPPDWRPALELVREHVLPVLRAG